MLGEELFNEWAKRYDESVLNEVRFPFAGYTDVLTEMTKHIEINSDTTICDVGIGTGMLSSYLSELGAKITGIDFSEKMLDIAKARIKNGVFYQREIEKGFLKEENYHYIITSYVLHHFPLEEKVELIKEMINHLLPNGKLIIGDISFPTEKDFLECRGKDEEEFYMIQDEITKALLKEGITFEYKQISFCASVIVIHK